MVKRKRRLLFRRAYVPTLERVFFFFGVEGSNPVANHGFGAERYLSALLLIVQPWSFCDA